MAPFLLPLSLCIILPVTFIVTYTIAVTSGHAGPLFPYISALGAYSPESCIYGQVLNICAVLVGLSVYVRCRQVSEFHNSPNNPGYLLKLNRISLYLGFVSACSVSLIGNFQESNVQIVHRLGQVVAFFSGVLFCLIQTHMSYRMHPQMTSLLVCHLRLVISIIIVISITISVIAAPIATSQANNLATKSNSTDPTSFESLLADQEAPARLLSTLSLWINVSFLLAYFATYVREFRLIKVEAPQFTLSITPLEMYAISEEDGGGLSMMKIQTVDFLRQTRHRLSQIEERLKLNTLKGAFLSSANRSHEAGAPSSSAVGNAHPNSEQAKVVFTASSCEEPLMSNASKFSNEISTSTGSKQPIRVRQSATTTDSNNDIEASAPRDIPGIRSRNNTDNVIVPVEISKEDQFPRPGNSASTDISKTPLDSGSSASGLTLPSAGLLPPIVDSA